MAFPHNFHVHDVQFRFATIGGPAAARARRLEGHGLPAPQTRLRLIMRFTDYADPDPPYMYHCHLLCHEDRG